MVRAQVNQIQNIAMLELVVTLFLGLLLKLDVVDAEDEHSGLFDGIIALMTALIFLYPVITMILTSKRSQNSVLSRCTWCTAPSLTTTARGSGGESEPQHSGAAAADESEAEDGSAHSDASDAAQSLADVSIHLAPLTDTEEAGLSRGHATIPASCVLWTNPIATEMEPNASSPAAAYELHEISILPPEDDTDLLSQPEEYIVLGCDKTRGQTAAAYGQQLLHLAGSMKSYPASPTSVGWACAAPPPLQLLKL